MGKVGRGGGKKFVKMGGIWYFSILCSVFWACLFDFPVGGGDKITGNGKKGIEGVG